MHFETLKLKKKVEKIITWHENKRMDEDAEEANKNTRILNTVFTVSTVTSVKTLSK